MTSASVAGTGAFVLGWLVVLRRHSYVALCLALLPMVAWRLATGVWEADFWEHAAVVDELALRPFAPLHPMLGIDAPHALSSPYHLGLATISRMTGASGITVLAFAAIANLALFCVTLRVFVRLFTRRALAPFLALLFTLLLWGPEPWEWSGFYHLRSFSNVMPYPSTFATACAFLALWTTRAFLLSGRLRWAAATAALAWLTLLVHPATFAFAVAGMAVVVVTHWRPRHRRRAAFLIGSLTVACVAALLWPYYPLVGLPGADPAGYLRDNDDILTIRSVLVRIAPAGFVGLPFLVLRFMRRRRDALVLLFVAVTVIYLVARVGHLGGLATTLRFVVLTLHVAGAAGFAALLTSARRPAAEVVGTVLVAGSVIFLVAAPTTAVGRGVAGLDRAEIPDLSLLGSAVPEDAVVMADALTALEVPAWGPTVIAWEYAMPFVEDREARRSAVGAFYAAGTTDRERKAILDRYCAEWVLVVPERLDRVGGAAVSDLVKAGISVERSADGRSLLAPVGRTAACESG